MSVRRRLDPAGHDLRPRRRGRDRLAASDGRRPVAGPTTSATWTRSASSSACARRLRAARCVRRRVHGARPRRRSRESAVEVRPRLRARTRSSPRPRFRCPARFSVAPRIEYVAARVPPALSTTSCSTRGSESVSDEQFELCVDGTNLFDESYQEIAGVAMPGAAVAISLAIGSR